MASYSKFLSLPREIRRMIYKELFTGVTVYPLNGPCIHEKGLSTENFLTAIFETSHECYDEAKLIFRETVRFNFEASDKDWLVREHPDSPLPLPEHLSQADLGRIRHLCTGPTHHLDANLPAVFPNLRSITVDGHLFDSYDTVTVSKDQLINVIHHGSFQQQIAEAIRSQFDAWASPVPVEGFRRWEIEEPSAVGTARMLLRERNENSKRYKIIIHAPLELQYDDDDVSVRLLDFGVDEGIHSINYYYDVDTGVLTFDKDHLCALTKELEEREEDLDRSGIAEWIDGAVSNTLSADAELSQAMDRTKLRFQ